MKGTAPTKVLQSFKLAIPAIIPSWRFFDTIAPSPRIECTTFDHDGSSSGWQEYRPRPEHVSFPTMMKRMLWNPWWNDTLFLVSCSERLMQNPTDHSYNEILKRIQSDLLDSSAAEVQFRLVFIARTGSEIEKHFTFTSEKHALHGRPSP